MANALTAPLRRRSVRVIGGGSHDALDTDSSQSQASK